MDGESEKVISGIIKTPFLKIQPYNHVSFCFLFEGFFIEIFTPGFGFKREGIINPKKNILVVPVIDLFDIPEMKEAIIVGIQKGFRDKAK